MTTPAPQPPPAASGPDREDQAQQAGAAVGAAMQAAEAAILASVAASVLAVLAGSLTVQMAKRKIRVAISSALGAAMRRAGPVIAHLPPEVQGQVRQAVLNAQASAGRSALQAIAAATGRPAPGSTGPDMSELAMRQLREAKGSKGGPFRDIEDAHRAAVQAAMGEKLSRLRQAQKVMDDLASRGITGFTDKAGRNWSLSSYAEMATRTAQSRLILQDQLKLMGPAGVSLAVVDDPTMTAPCPKCRPWQGKLIALAGDGSGTSTITDAHGVRRTEQIAGTLAEATAAGLFHPSCRCGLSPWHDGAAMVPTAGGQQRGYVVAGQPVSRSLPLGTPRQYEDEQKLRGHERSVRRAQVKASAALTPQAKRAARTHLAASRAALEAHVAATGATRLPGREKAFRADRKAHPGQPYQAR